MKEEILNYLDSPKQMEKLYRSNKSGFRQVFNTLYPQLRGNAIADYWNERLNYESEELQWGSRHHLLFVLISSLIAGLLAKLPAIFNIGEAFFYSRNTGFIVFPVLAAYFAWKNKLSAGKIGFIAVSMLAGLVFINLLPDNRQSDTLVLSCIHLALFLWAVLGFAYAGTSGNDTNKRLGFLKYNGDLVVICTLIVIAGGILSGMTIGLFSLIGLNIEDFYFKNIVMVALPAVPVIGTYLTQTNPQLVGRISPLIARIFSPLVLLMLVVYLVAIMVSAKDPFNDREFLLIFNVLLIGVMALIFFSVAETSGNTKSRIELWVLFILSVVTIVVNGIAIAAIIFRISEWGISPNRIAVLGGNILILINLLLVTLQLYKTVSGKGEVGGVGRQISYYLPVYWVWTIVVTFIFPFIFNFK